MSSASNKTHSGSMASGSRNTRNGATAQPANSAAHATENHIENAQPAQAAFTKGQFITQHGSQYTLNAAPEGMHFGREGNDLVVTDASGKTEKLSNFFVTAGNDLPDMVLADGTVIAAHDFLQAQNPDMDLATAAGGSLTSNSGGLGSYGDDSGSLVGGFDRLGSLGTFQWGRANSPLGGSNAGTRSSALGVSNADGGFDDGSTGGGAGGGSTGGGSGGGEVTPTPPAPLNYEARAVLYKTEGNASETVGFRLLGADGKPLPVQNPADVEMTDRNGFFDLDNAVFNPDGTVTLTLTQDGRNALLAANGANLYDYITVTVDGREYTMQVVVNQDGNFNSAAEDALLHNGSNQSGYEWHSEQDGSATGDRNVHTGTTENPGNNEAWFTNTTGNTGEAAFSGSFVAHDGNDTVTINSAGVGMGKGNSTQSGSLIDLGGGTDSLTITSTNAGMKAEAGFDNTARNVGGNVTVNSASDAMYAEGTGATNTISSVTKDVTLTSAQGSALHSFMGGNNTLSTIGGSVTLTGGISAEKTGSSNTIEHVGGSMFVSSNSNAISAATESTNTIYDVKENLTISGNGYGMSGTTLSKNVIDSIGGNVELTSKNDVLFVSNSTNTISNVKGDVTLTSSNGSGMSAQDGGANTLDTIGGSFTINSSKNMSAANGATNSISNVTGNITLNANVTLKDYPDRPADGASQEEFARYNQAYNEVYRYNNQLSSNCGNIYSSNGGLNTIAGVGGSIILNTSSDGFLGGMRATGAGSINSITDVTDDVIIPSTTWQIAGITAADGGSNIINNVGRNVTMTSLVSSGVGSTNTINNVTHDVTIQLGGATNSNSIVSNKGGANTISNIGGNVNANILSASDGSTNIIKGVDGNVSLVQLRSDQDGVNLISDVKTDVTVSGIVSSCSTNTIQNIDGNVTLKETLWSNGKSSSGESGNIIRDVQKSVTVIFNDPLGTGMIAQVRGSNTIERIGGDVVISANYLGMHASESSSFNRIDGVKGDVSVTGTKYAAMYAQIGTNCISNVGGKITLTGRLFAQEGGINLVDQRGSEHALTLTIKATKNLLALDSQAWTGDSGKNLIYGSDHDDVISITGGIGHSGSNLTDIGTNLIDTGKGNDIIHLDGKVQHLTLQAGEGYDILVLHCDSLADLSANYQSWLTSLMTQNHGVESIQIEGLSTIGDLPNWLTSLASSHGVDLSLHGGNVDTDHAASTDYAADTSYVVDLHGNALHDNVTLNSGHDKVDIHDGLNTHLDTGAGNDFVTVHGGIISPSAGIDLGSGNDHLTLSGAIHAGADAFKGGSGYDALHIGDMTHLNGNEANGGHINLSDLAGVLDGFEVVDMTGGSGTHLTIDASTVLAQFGIDAGSHGNFTGSAAASFTDTNTLVIKGDGSDTVSIDTDHWTAQSTVIDQNHNVFDVYSHTNGAEQEFILIQQQIITQAS